MGSEGGAVNFPPVSSGFWGADGFFSAQKWRPFCLKFEGVVEDFNFGTLLRLDCSEDYTEENSIFGEHGAGSGIHGSTDLLFSFLYFLPSFSHQDPVFCHRNRSEQRGLEQHRLRPGQGAGGCRGVGVRMGQKHPCSSIYRL